MATDYLAEPLSLNSQLSDIPSLLHNPSCLSTTK